MWQLNRAEQKIALANSLASRLQMPVLNANLNTNITGVGLEQAQERRMIARGHFLPDDAVWLDNRPRPIPEGGIGSAAQAGFYVMMPLKLVDQDVVVWVNRGWAPRNNMNRLELPPISTSDGVVTIEGIVFPHPGRVFELGKKGLTETKPRIEQNFDLAVEAQTHPWKQLPWILREENPTTNDGLVRNWPSPTNGVDRHYAYAFQWFALALCGFLFWFINGFIGYRRLRKECGD